MALGHFFGAFFTAAFLGSHNPERVQVPFAPARDRTLMIVRVSQLLMGATGRFEDGLTQALEEISKLLMQHFALAPGDANTNELPDAPVLGQSR